MFASGQTIIEWMEQLAPMRYAMEGDKIGLQLGTLNKPVQKALVALDVTDQVIDEAIEAGVNLIIAHHAIIYRPLPHLRIDTPAGKKVEKLIKNDIAVYIAHTNLDVAEGGINDMMAELLGMTELAYLEKVWEENGKSYGLGRAGMLSEPMTVEQLAETTKKVFDIPAVRVVGDLKRVVKKIAVLGGSGGKFVNDAIRAGAEVFITGDIDYHDAHDALDDGIALIDVGHNVEKIMKERVANHLNSIAQNNGYDSKIIASTMNTEPFRFL